MSVDRTLQQRGHAPLKTVGEALTTDLSTGQLPPLPPKVTATDYFYCLRLLDRT
jgi:hypothetical protein